MYSSLSGSTFPPHIPMGQNVYMLSVFRRQCTVLMFPSPDSVQGWSTVGPLVELLSPQHT